MTPSRRWPISRSVAASRSRCCPTPDRRRSSATASSTRRSTRRTSSTDIRFRARSSSIAAGSSRRASSNRLYQERSTISSVLVRLGRHVDGPATKIAGAHRRADLVCDRPGRNVRDPFFAGAGRSTRPARACLCARRVRLQAGAARDRRRSRALSCRSAQFPKPEDYFFKPLNEHVLVYQHPFRIVQDVVLDPSRDGSAALKDVTTLTITGTFDYQACDDKVCFAPQSIPLSWSIDVKQLDRERPKRQ